MEEIIKVISNAFSRGYALGLCESKGEAVSKHKLQSALKEQIESACKVIRPHNKPVEPTGDTMRCVMLPDGESPVPSYWYGRHITSR